MRYTITTTTPAGKQRTRDCKNIREAGQAVAWCLHDNLNIDKRAATQLGMQAERERTLTHAGYIFTIQETRNMDHPARGLRWQMYEDDGSDPARTMSNSQYPAWILIPSNSMGLKSGLSRTDRSTVAGPPIRTVRGTER
jgi:hypothetical protein